MNPALPLQLESPAIFVAGILLTVIAAVIALIRRRGFPGLFLMGMICLSMAAGGVIWRISHRPMVAVMVDLSASTRGAGFRDAGNLQRRIRELLGDREYQVIGFDGENRPLDLAHELVEMPGDETKLSPVAADDILLFSDCRFAIPDAEPATFVVADGGLEESGDASVKHLEIRDRVLAATIQNSGGARTVTFTGTSGAASEIVSTGTIVLTRPLAAGVETASVRLSAGDLWPENDSLSIRVGPGMGSEMWWVGSDAPSKDFRVISPGELPADAAGYLGSGIVVLNNISANELSAAAVDRLGQYVRDLGGSVLILGGDHAFGAGEYLGTGLDAMSPLASAPPEARVRWVLLVDASGSMAGGNWESASGAVAHVLSALPPEDAVQIGQFSDEVKWWATGKTVGEARAMNLPPGDAMPRGPTNLEAALEQVADQVDASMPSEVALLSDCDAKIGDVAGIIAKFSAKKIHLHVLELGHGSGVEAIGQIAAATGGGVVEEDDAKKWAGAVRKLAESAMPEGVVKQAVEVKFMGLAESVGEATAGVWDRTWLKPDATLLAKSDAGDAMGAVWQVGRGSVGAFGFSPDAATSGALARLAARKPRDPRFAVTWDAGENLRVTIDALEDGKFMNDLPFSLEAGGRSMVIPQTGPGRYEISVALSRESGIASVVGQGRIVDQIAIAGRYAPEFEAVGNDHGAMKKLAERSGGAVIWPGDHGRTDLKSPTREENLTSWFAMLGALLFGVGLMRWRRNFAG